MPTIKQRKAVEELVANGGNVQKAMREVGYSENTLNTPKKLTESRGYKELCEEHGLTDSLILNSLREDIEDKPKSRVKELNLAAEITGLKPRYNKQQPVNQTTNYTQINVNNNPQVQELADEYETKLLDSLKEV